MSVERIVPGAISAALSRASAATGVDFAHLAETARRESAFKADAKAATSSATGLFQFIESTWLEMVARHGAKHGRAAEAAAIDLSSGRARVADPETRRAILALRSDAELSARLAGELTLENAAALTRSLGRRPNSNELYAAHVLGPGGAARLIAAAEAGAGDAAALFPKEAAANRGLFFDRSGAPRSAPALLARFEIDPQAAPGGPPSELSEGRLPPGDGGLAPALLQALFALPLLGIGGDADATAAAPEIALLRNAAYRAAQGAR